MDHASRSTCELRPEDGQAAGERRGRVHPQGEGGTDGYTTQKIRRSGRQNRARRKPTKSLPPSRCAALAAPAPATQVNQPDVSALGRRRRWRRRRARAGAGSRAKIDPPRPEPRRPRNPLVRLARPARARFGVAGDLLTLTWPWVSGVSPLHTQQKLTDYSAAECVRAVGAGRFSSVSTGSRTAPAWRRLRSVSTGAGSGCESQRSFAIAWRGVVLPDAGDPEDTPLRSRVDVVLPQQVYSA
jgi:hypothetical protein